MAKIKREKQPFIYAAATFILPPYYKLVFKMNVMGLENVPATGPLILVSNHVTARDPVFLGCFIKQRQINFMAKASLFKNKILGWLIHYAGAFPVERGTGGGDALQAAYNLLDKDKTVGVFIEGTRSMDGKLLRPKTGVSLLAYQTHATVLPVCIISKDGTRPSPFKGKTTINIGKPIPFEELGIEEGSSMHFRRGAKLIMSKISDLRDEAIKSME